MPDVEYNCPICQRVLVRVHEDGKFDLAGLASIEYKFNLMAAIKNGAADGIIEPGTAKCHKFGCCIKRWWRRLK